MTPAECQQEHARLASRIAHVQRELDRTRRLVAYLDELESGRVVREPSAAIPSAGIPAAKGRRRGRGPTIQEGLTQLLAGGTRLKLREVGEGLAALAVAFKPNSLRSALSQLKKRGVVVTHPAPGRGDLYALP